MSERLLLGSQNHYNIHIHIRLQLLCGMECAIIMPASHGLSLYLFFFPLPFPFLTLSLSLSLCLCLCGLRKRNSNSPACCAISCPRWRLSLHERRSKTCPYPKDKKMHRMWGCYLKQGAIHIVSAYCNCATVATTASASLQCIFH